MYVYLLCIFGGAHFAGLGIIILFINFIYIFIIINIIVTSVIIIIIIYIIIIIIILVPLILLPGNSRAVLLLLTNSTINFQHHHQMIKLPIVSKVSNKHLRSPLPLPVIMTSPITPREAGC